MFRAGFKNYNRTVRRSTITFPCPECKLILQPKSYETHCTKHHNLNSKYCCVWCGGAHSWPNGKKQQNVDHLMMCFKAFISIKEEKVEPPPETVVFFDHTPMCPAEDFFGKRRIDNLPDRAYGTVWPLELSLNGLTFQNPNINLAVSYVRFYLKFKDDIEVFHVMVRANTFQEFLRVMDEDRGQSCALQFSCWCDGGTHEMDIYRHHRHMIVVSKPKGHFIPNVWKKIKISDRPHKNFKCLRLKPIHSPMHLVNTINYVSRRESKCNFSPESKLKHENKNHFYISLTLPYHHKLILVLQWDGGILTLAEELTNNMNSKELVKGSQLINGQWRIRVRNIPGIVLNLLLPVDRRFTPTTDTITDYYVHLNGGRKIYFDKRVTETTSAVNLFFYNVVGHEYIVPRRKHQAFLNDLQACLEPYQKEITELKKRISRLEDQNVLGQLKEWMESADRTHEELKSTLGSMEEGINYLKMKLETTNSGVSVGVINTATINIFHEKRSRMDE